MVDQNKAHPTDVHFILVDRRPVRERDLYKWSLWMATSRDRLVGYDVVDGVEVSTVFTGINLSPVGGDEPVLFETALFDHAGNGDVQRRYATWEEAEQGHFDHVHRLRAL